MHVAAMDIASSRHADFPQTPATDQDQFSGRPVLRGLQRGCLWFLAAVSPFVFIEPSPYEFAFLVVLVIFIGTGLRFAPAALSLVAILGVLNLGYTIGAINLFEKQEVLYWVLTSWYLALTAIFFALALSENTQERLDALLRGYRFAAVVVSLLAIAGYFNLIPGAQEQLTLYSRARGTFKDPNVLGGFLILPAIYCLQKMIDESARSALRNAIAFAIISLAVLLSFSRAAWGILAFTAMASVALNFLTTNSARKKLRILILVMLAAGVTAAMLSVLLSFDAFANLFKERASLVQGYDAGRFGRFGRHPRCGYGPGLSVRNRPAAVQQVLSRGHAQLVPQCVHVRRLAERRDLSAFDRRDAAAQLAESVRGRALVAGIKGAVRHLRRSRRREPDHRHRPLAALLHADRSRVGRIDRLQPRRELRMVSFRPMLPAN